MSSLKFSYLTVTRYIVRLHAYAHIISVFVVIECWLSGRLMRRRDWWDCWDRIRLEGPSDRFQSTVQGGAACLSDETDACMWNT